MYHEKKYIEIPEELTLLLEKVRGNEFCKDSEHRAGCKALFEHSVCII